MKPIGFLAAGLTLLLLAAAPAPDDKVNAKPLPGFPDIKYNAPLLEQPRDAQGKPLLKLVRADYDEGYKLVIFLLELQADIGFDEKLSIDKVWCPIGSSAGPSAFFFDKDGVALYFRTLKQAGKLSEGKKGDRIRLILDPGMMGFPDAVYVEIRRSPETPR
jgi:hypothetical protein